MYKNKKKLLIIFTLAAFLLAILLYTGRGSNSAENASVTPPTSPPQLSADEACAHVYDYLTNQASLASTATIRSRVLTWTSDSRQYWSASYDDNGKWAIQGLGIATPSGSSISLSTSFPMYTGGIWFFFETTLVVEPANSEASDLLLLLSSDQ